VEALTGPQDEVSTMRQIFERRRDLMVAEINSIPGIFVVKPPGAFYAFVNTSQLAGRTNIADSTDVANYLLKRHHVASVPGGPFGSDYHIRLSFTTSDDVILEGMKRIRKAFQELV
jgi:aspartate aminotransferase